MEDAEAQRKREKKERKEAKKEKKRKEREAEAAGTEAATEDADASLKRLEEDREQSVRKRHKTEKREKSSSSSRAAEEDQSAAAASCAAATDGKPNNIREYFAQKMAAAGKLGGMSAQQFVAAGAPAAAAASSAASGTATAASASSQRGFTQGQQEDYYNRMMSCAISGDGVQQRGNKKVGLGFGGAGTGGNSASASFKAQESKLLHAKRSIRLDTLELEAHQAESQMHAAPADSPVQAYEEEVEDAAAVDEEAERKRRKAEKKEAKKRKREAEAEAAEAKRTAVEAEVLAAGARALQEEADELTAQAAMGGNEAAEETEEQRRARKEAKKAKRAAETEEERAARKRAKKEKKEKEGATAEGAEEPPAKKVYPPPPPGNTTLLLFYQYVRPPWSVPARQKAENFARDSLARHGCTGRLRCAREGFNATLTGPAQGIRAFCQDLREFEPQHFGNTDFKIVDGLRDNQMLKGLKVWHVDELVTYGFGHKGQAPIEQGGTHLSPQDWHNRAAEDNTVLIDVRNANENAIGRFQPLGDAERVLDPLMRVSTEFPEWVDKNMDKLQKAKNIMMYCTGGIRCERASALLVQKGLPPNKVFQLEGGIHRYLEAFPDGGHWIGQNYTFDRRFGHGATTREPEVVGRCACCSGGWSRYQAGKRCANCRMEVLVCRDCERSGKMKTVRLLCFLCGGPKPSYLPEDANTFAPPKPKPKQGKIEADY